MLYMFSVDRAFCESLYLYKNGALFIVQTTSEASSKTRALASARCTDVRLYT